MNQYQQAVNNAAANLRVSNAILANADAQYEIRRAACMGVIRALFPGAVRQWTPQGSNGLNPEDDHLFEARYCGKLFAICVTQMRIIFPAFEPLLSDAIYVAEEICNDQTNLISIPQDFHRMKTRYFNENSPSGEVFF